MFLVILLFTIMNNKNEFVINKSKFITYIFHINDKCDIDNILNDIKQGKEVTPNTLNKLWEFIKKYEPLISISSSLIQTIIAILGIA